MNGRSTGRSTLPRPATHDPIRPRPPGVPPPRRADVPLRRGGRRQPAPAEPGQAAAFGDASALAMVVASALVLVLTGTAWGLYRDVTAGITTTDVIAGGGDGGDQNILLVGVDSRTDAQGNPLPHEVRGSCTAAPTPAC